MFNVTERKGVPHVFNLNDGSVLRLYAYETASLSKALAKSVEIVNAEKMGLITLVEVPTTTTTKGGKE